MQVDEVAFELGAQRSAVIRALPSMRVAFGQPALVDQGPHPADGLERVQLLEGCEYLFEIRGCTAAAIDRAELFISDDESGCRGRLRTKLATGRVEVTVTLDGAPAAPFAFEVRSTKLGYLDDYRWMLEAIARFSTGLVLDRFAPSEQRLEVDPHADPATLYQQFVFLRGLLESEVLASALQRIIAAPYVEWRATEELSRPSAGLRGSGALARNLSRAGQRIAWPGPLETVPVRLPQQRTEETIDNLPNRFVLFALHEWRRTVAAIADALATERPTAPVRRGLAETAALLDRLDDLTAAPVFRGIGRLVALPGDNQVLEKQDGYREVVRAYYLAQLGATLAWAGGDEVFHGGQRNVATLYEYWVYLELAQLVSDCCDDKLDLASLVAREGSHLTLELRSEHVRVLRGGFARHGRRFRVELRFNHEFKPGPRGTWTKAMRPDCSLHLTPEDPARADDDIWVHFDAKYRIDSMADLLGAATRTAKSADLDKMHAYRDGIIRAVGAYVIFPGTEVITREQYDEVLPGLGAFPLRPTAAGEAFGVPMLRALLERTFAHVADQTTKHERVRHWTRTATAGPPLGAARDAAAFFAAPPADSAVLLGYVKSLAHHAWILRERRYNLRADPARGGAIGLRAPELSASYLALHGACGEGPCLFHIVDEPALRLARDLRDAGYPEPRGQVYFCFALEPITYGVPAWLTPAYVATLAEPGGAPRLISGLALMRR